MAGSEPRSSSPMSERQMDGVDLVEMVREGVLDLVRDGISSVWAGSTSSGSRCRQRHSGAFEEEGDGEISSVAPSQ